MREERRLGRVGTVGRLLADAESGGSQPSILRGIQRSMMRSASNQGNLTGAEFGTPSSCSHFRTK